MAHREHGKTPETDAAESIRGNTYITQLECVQITVSHPASGSSG
jgi:hypothetical protein